MLCDTLRIGMEQKHALKTYREQNNLSRTEVAKRIGITLGMVAHIENGVRKPSPELALKAESVGIPKNVLRPDLWPVEGQA